MNVFTPRRSLMILVQGLFALVLWAATPSLAVTKATPQATSAEFSRQAVLVPRLDEDEADDHQPGVALQCQSQIDDDDPRLLGASVLVLAVVPRDRIVSDLAGLRGVKPQPSVRATPPTGPPNA